MSAPTQAQRILRVLERSGNTGTTQIDWLSPTIDGGPPILRVPARIADLRARGHEITSTVEPIGNAHLAVYRLRSQRSGKFPERSTQPSAEQASLAIDEPGRRPRSPLDPEVA